jgi:hypothetical protein
MPPDLQGERQKFLKGAGSLTVALLLVVLLLTASPAYRWFFLVSLGIGLVVAGGLYLWHRLRPVKEAEVDNKRPLGL